MITVKLEGADKLLTKLRAYAMGVSKKVQEEVGIRLLLIESDAKALSPVDTGLNRSQIRANLNGKFSGSVTANSKYAYFLEMGTYKMAAQPFLMPAYLKNKQAFLANIKEALKFRF